MINATLILSIFLFVYIMFIFFVHNVINILLYWMPFSNLFGFLLAQFVNKDLDGLIQGVTDLENLKYSYKSV